MNDAVEEYREQIFKKLNFKINPAIIILDIGCGDGRDSVYFAERGAAVIGLDQLESGMWKKFSQKFPRLSFQKGDGEKLPFPKESFDLVYAKDVVHHTPHPEKFMKEALRVVKKGGQLVSIEANRYNPLFYFHMTLLLGHEHFTRSYFKKIILNTAPSNKVKFHYFEAHVFPFPKFLRNTLYRIQDLSEKIIFWKPFLSYNSARINK